MGAHAMAEHLPWSVRESYSEEGGAIGCCRRERRRLKTRIGKAGEKDFEEGGASTSVGWVLKWHLWIHLFYYSESNPIKFWDNVQS